MADFVTLSCPSCGGKLQVTPDLDRFACAHCGNEHVVRRGGGVVSLAPIVEGIDKVRAGVDKTASELAIQRLKEEIPVLRHRREEEIVVLQNRRTKQLAALRAQRPSQPKEPEGNSIIAPIGLIVCLVGLYELLLAFKTADSLMGLVGFALLVAPMWAFWSSSKNDKRKAAEYTANLEAFQRQCTELDSTITAKIGEIDAEIAAKTTELDAELAAKTTELDEHTRTVRVR